MRIAVVGVGRWGLNHVRVLSEIQKTALEDIVLDEIIVADRDLARAKYVASLYNIANYTSDLDELVKLHIDAAIVAVPTLYHCDVVMKLLPHTNVLVEKPLAAKLDEAEKMGKLAEREGRLLAVGHVERFNPVVHALKEKILIENGKVVSISAQRIGPGPAREYSLNLGVAHDLLIHDVDISMYLLDTLPSEVLARALWEHGRAFETEVVAIYTYDDLGVIGEFRASWRASPSFKKRTISVQLDNALLEADYILQTITLERGLVEHKSKGEFSELISAYTSRVKETWSVFGVRKEPLLLEDLHFLRCVAKGERPLISWEIGFRALKCVLAALESAKHSRPQRIEW